MYYLEQVYTKNNFNPAKIFLLNPFKIAANQTECYRLEQKSVR